MGTFSVKLYVWICPTWARKSQATHANFGWLQRSSFGAAQYLAPLWRPRHTMTNEAPSCTNVERKEVPPCPHALLRPATAWPQDLKAYKAFFSIWPRNVHRSKTNQLHLGCCDYMLHKWILYISIIYGTNWYNVCIDRYMQHRRCIAWLRLR